MARQALTIAAHFPKPATFNGTATSWRVLCDLYPAAESVEVICAVIDYCAVRRLDPFKRPVHIVAMYNSKLRRKVQVVMQGINEIEITAARTGKWAGMDPPQWGPEVERTFRGSFENDDGSTTATEVTLRYPEWCSVTVYRMVGDQRAGFTEQLWWEECYARAGFRSEVPNSRWQQGRRQMLHKCTKAAVLRATFPEEGFGYAAEEMEGRDTEGGFTIEGMAEPAETGAAAAPAGQALNGGAASQAREYRPDQRAAPETREAARERLSDAYADAPDEPTGAERLGHEPNGTRWLALLDELAGAAASEDELGAIASHSSVSAALDTAPSLIKERIREILRKAHERLAPAPDDPAPEAFAGDPFVADLLAQVAGMTMERILALPNDQNWRNATRDLFPPDFETIDIAIADRRRELEEEAKGGNDP